MKTKDIEQLINKYLEGETSPAEEQKLALELQRPDIPWGRFGEGPRVGLCYLFYGRCIAGGTVPVSAYPQRKCE